MAEIVPDLTQFDQKLALFGPFLDEFSGIQYQVEALQHFFSSLLKAHLIVENFMNSFIPAIFSLEDFEDLRLTFSQKAKMLPQRGSSAAFVRPDIIQLNRVRNKYGHRLNHSVEFNEIGAIMEVLAVARSETVFEKPIDAIEAFVPITCAFLSLPPKHLREAFLQAFRHVHSMTPEQV